MALFLFLFVAAGGVSAGEGKPDRRR